MGQGAGRLGQFGQLLRLDLDPRIYRRPEGLPILHTATFPLPQHDGDFGSGAIASMKPGDVFCALLEYDRDLAGTGLFAPPGLPLPVRAADASPAALQRMLPGRVGLQLTCGIEEVHWIAMGV